MYDAYRQNRSDEQLWTHSVQNWGQNFDYNYFLSNLSSLWSLKCWSRLVKKGPTTTYWNNSWVCWYEVPCCHMSGLIVCAFYIKSKLHRTVGTELVTGAVLQGNNHSIKVRLWCVWLEKPDDTLVEVLDPGFLTIHYCYTHGWNTMYLSVAGYLSSPKILSVLVYI